MLLHPPYVSCGERFAESLGIVFAGAIMRELARLRNRNAQIAKGNMEMQGTALALATQKAVRAAPPRLPGSLKASN